MDYKVIDNIVWYIPFKKLRNALKEYLRFLFDIKYDVSALKEEIKVINHDVSALKEEIKVINYDVSALKEEIKPISDNRFKEYLIKTGYDKIAPIGYYESPYPSEEELLRGFKNIEDGNSFMYNINAINMNDDVQLEFYKSISTFFDNFNFTKDKSDKYRYYFDNGFYGYGCGLYLYSIINYVKPKNIIEIGSGFSTALMLDINSNLFNNTINLLSIEPRADRLKSTLLKTDNIKLLEKEQQDVSLDTFSILEENDILFIDSSHVCRPFGDINRQFFEILPSLNKGVIVHIHDIFYPFEYPKFWIYNERRAYTEAYILRAFLQYNDTFEILLFPNYLKDKYSQVEKHHTGSIYLRKVK